MAPNGALLVAEVENKFAKRSQQGTAPLLAQVITKTLALFVTTITQLTNTVANTRLFNLTNWKHASTRSRDDKEPNVTRRRLRHHWKQQSHDSRTPSGVLASSTPLSSKQETPIGSKDEEEPNITRRMCQYNRKQQSDRSRTLLGMDKPLVKLQQSPMFALCVNEIH